MWTFKRSFNCTKISNSEKRKAESARISIQRFPFNSSNPFQLIFIWANSFTLSGTVFKKVQNARKKYAHIRGNRRGSSFAFCFLRLLLLRLLLFHRSLWRCECSTLCFAFFPMGLIWARILRPPLLTPKMTTK